MTDSAPPPPGSPAQHADHARTSNPFRASRVRPGGVPFLFPPEVPPGDNFRPHDLTDVLEVLRRHDWWGAIVGPHGAGKSSLVAALRPAVEAAGWKTVLIELHDGQRKFPWEQLGSVQLSNAQPNERLLVIVDGYEQLTYWHALRLRRHCQSQQHGLLVTTHQPSRRIPLVATLHVDDATLRLVLAEYLRAEPELLPASLELARKLLPQHHGNLRDVLFELYDAYENGQLQAASQSRD